MKRVLLFVIDGWTARLLGPALDQGQLPMLARLADAGSLAVDCVSIFPSITPAATASIITGRYPCEHGITGMSWWNPESEGVSYFGDDVWTVAQRGLGEFLRDYLLHLNDSQLRAPTLFQTVERHGLRAGCFNYLIFRGDVKHVVKPPLLLRLWPGVPSTLAVHGPSLLCLGDFVSDRPDGEDPAVKGGIFSRFGLDDEGTTEFLLKIASAAELPDFTVAYFADYDFDSHEEGPEAALETLRSVDGRLSRIIENWGGLDRVLAEACILITADHSHSDVGAGNGAAVVLDDVLEGFTLANPGSGWNHGEALMVCPNLRSAEIHVNKAGPASVAAVCDALTADPRIDQVIWREGGPVSGQVHVVTGDRGRLRFSIGGDGEAQRDTYGTRWRVTGSLEAIDAMVEDGTLQYGAYPNALERIAAAFELHDHGRVWVTARPGYEFRTAGQRTHLRGGSHGTLHELDSIVPLLIAGAPDDVQLPPAPRIVDVEPLCRLALGLPPRRPPGS
jgi:hypothetical protein